jgi:hypothetical protein
MLSFLQDDDPLHPEERLVEARQQPELELLLVEARLEEPEQVAALAPESVNKFYSRSVSSCYSFIKREDLERSRHIINDS